MTENIKRILYLAKGELKGLLSRRMYLFAMIFAPLISYVFFITMMWGGLPNSLPAVVVDLDNSSVSRNVTRQLDAFQQTDVVAVTDDFQQARRMMQQGKVYGIMLLPEGLERKASTGQQPDISYYTNNSFLIAGSLLYRDMRMMSILASGAANLKVREAKGQTEGSAMAQFQPIVIDAHPIGNPWLNYSVYLSNIILPGILQLMIMLVTVYSIGMEVKNKTARLWLSRAEGSLTAALLSKLLPQTLIFFLMGLMLQSILYGFLQFPIHGKFLEMAAAMFLLVISCQGLGVFMIGMLPNVRLGLSFASLWGIISFSISGMTFPALAMDPTLQALSTLFPLRHYFLIYVDQALNGIPLYYTLWQYVWLLLFLLLPVLVQRRLKYALLRVHYSL